MRVSTLRLLSTAVVSGKIATPSAVVKRDPVPDSILCNIQNFQRDTSDDLLTSQINILRSSASGIILGKQAGGGWCSRLACSNGSNGDVGIYACNDAAVDVLIDGSTVADFAEAIKRKGKKTWNYVQGQAFNHNGGWNVILGRGDGESC